MTPPILIGIHNPSSSGSVAACTQSQQTSSKSGGMSVCNQPRKQKVANVGLGCTRSNLAVNVLES